MHYFGYKSRSVGGSTHHVPIGFHSVAMTKKSAAVSSPRIDDQPITLLHVQVDRGGEIFTYFVT